MQSILQPNCQAKSLSGYTTRRLLRMAELSEWFKWWEAPPKDLKETITDLQKSGITPETCQKARLIPLTYFLRRMDETSARRLIKVITRLSSSRIDSRDLLKDGELIGFPYFSQDGELLFVRIRSYPPLVFRDADGEEREVKYLQPKGVPALPYIPPEVWNVTQKPHKPVWLTEGEKKALSLTQHDRYAVALSGVWNFRSGERSARTEEDRDLWQELQAFNWSGRVVYLGFDMDMWVNPQVRLALFELGLKLISRGAVVRVPLWDKNLKGIDDFLNQYPDRLDEIEEKARRLEDVIREEDIDGVVRALSMVELVPERREQLYRNLTRRLGVRFSTLEKAVWRKSKEEAQEQKPAFPEEVLKEAQDVLKGNVTDRLMQDLEKLYAGRQEQKLLLYLTVMSRKVKNLPMNLMVGVKGDSSEGKSTLVRTILSLINQEEAMEISYQSRAYLYYGVNDLSHKVLFLTELEGSAKGLYGLKLAISEGVLLVRSVEADRGIRAINRRIPAKSMAVITTGVHLSMGEEMDTRSIVFTLNPDEELRFNALKVMALIDEEEKEKVKQLWQAVDSLIQPAEVVIPWIDRVVYAMKGKLVKGRYLRDFQKFRGLIQASALIHQHQRPRDEKGRIIAQREDYELVYRLQNLFTETLRGVPDYVVHVVSTLKDLVQQEKTRREQDKKIARDLFEEAESIKREKDGLLPVQLQELMQKMKALLSRPEEEKIRIKKSLLVEELARRTGKSERTARAWVEQTAKKDEWISIHGSGREGAFVELKVSEIPDPQFPFPEPSEIFDDVLPDCLINGKALSDNEINKANHLCPILPNSEEEIGQNESEELCLIHSIDMQGLDGNKAMRQSTEQITGQETGQESRQEIGQNEAKGSCLIYNLDTQGSDGNRAIGQRREESIWSVRVKDPTREDIRVLMETINRALKPPYKIDYGVDNLRKVLTLYIIEGNRVLGREELSLEEGLDYGQCFDAVEGVIRQGSSLDRQGPNGNKATGQETGQNEACLISSLDKQDQDGNKTHSPLWKRPPTVNRFTEKPNGEDERFISSILKNLSASPYLVECGLKTSLQVMSIYVCKANRVLCRVDLSVREGLDYKVIFSSAEKALRGEFKPVEGEDVPYPVYRVCGKTGKEAES